MHAWIRPLVPVEGYEDIISGSEISCAPDFDSWNYYVLLLLFCGLPLCEKVACGCEPYPEL